MKALVLGAEGMLGHKMFQTTLSQFPDTKCTTLGDLSASPLSGATLFSLEKTLQKMNVMEFDSFAKRIRGQKPDFLINCIGIIKQRDAAKAAVPSIFINSLLPHKLAELAREWGGRVIHFSTDCVFDGKRGGYTEDDFSNAEDLYGKSKFLGEVAGENALTLRTSIIGRELSSFASLLEWFLAQKGKTIRGYKKVIYSGVTTNYMAELVCKIIKDHPTLNGLYQVTSPSINKYDLLCRLKEAYKLDVEILEESDTVSDRSMVGDKFVKATGYSIPKWEHLVEQLVTDPTPYEDWR